MSISNYIEATRRNNPNWIKSEHYKERFFPFLQIPYLASGDDPTQFEAIVTFSHSRSVECVELGGNDYLIYDQYMGQTLNFLTRAVFEEKSEQAIKIYLLKYAAERFLQFGRSDLALWPALVYCNMKKGTDYFTKPNPTAVRARSVFVQELYLMAHEVYHSLFKRQPTLHSDAAIDARDFLESRRIFGDNLFASAVEEPVPPQDKSVAAIKNALGAGLQANSALVLELCCDRLAMNLCAVASSQLFGEEHLQQTLLSCYNAHLFSRALSFLDNDLERFANGEHRKIGDPAHIGSEVFSVHQARSSYIRKCAIQFSIDDPAERQKMVVSPMNEKLDSVALFKEFETVREAINDELTSPCMKLAAAFGTGQFFEDFSFLSEVIDRVPSEHLSSIRATEMCLGW